MKSIPFSNSIQYSFWGNVDYASNKDALKARNKAAKEFKAKGMRVILYTLANQECKYGGLGHPCGAVGNVYKMDVYPIINKENP